MASKSHVALVAFPFGTHAPPLFALARALASASPTTSLSFLSTSNSLDLFKSSANDFPNISLVPLSNGVPPGFTGTGHVEEPVGMFLGSMPGNLKDGLAKAKDVAGGVSVSCIISDAFLWVSGDVAKEMGVPWVALWTGGTAALSGHVYTDLIRLIRSTSVPADHTIASNKDAVLSFVPGIGNYKVSELPEGIVSGDLNSPFSRLLHRMGQKLPEARAVLLNTFQGLDPAIDTDFATKFSNYLPIGPLHLLTPKPSTSPQDPNKCLPWLDKQAKASVAYISFGSFMAPEPHEIAELAQALVSIGVPFIWSMKEKNREHLPGKFLNETKKKGMVVSWAPQLEVLAHKAVGVMVTHCGWNSIMEVLVAGVPLIVRPFFADQRMNATTVTEVWKVGVGLEGGVIKKEGMVRALNAILKGVEGKKIREKAEEIKDMAFTAVEEDGSSAKNLEELVKLVST